MIEAAVQSGPVQGITFVGAIFAIAIVLYVGYAILERAIAPIVEIVTEP
ncbi:DUF7512 family protein [Halorubrum gandharaense]